MSPADRTSVFAALAQNAIACAVDDLGSLRFDGADAAAFLHGQLSSDVRALSPGGLQRSSYNSPKGRMLASLLLWRPADERAGALRAFLAADLAAAIARRLGMFVLRAKATVRDASAERAVIGVAGPRGHDAVQHALGVTASAGEALAVEDAAVLGLPDGRVLIDLPRARRDDVLAALTRHATLADASVWRWTRVHAGVPLVTSATSDLFVAQALNFEVLGGVNFQKGCYPGQEIVARMQYLGRLKERLFAFRLAGDEPAPGTPLYAASFGEQVCGTVIQAAPHPQGGAALLAAVQRSAAEADTVRVGAPDGPALTPMALPYPVPEPAPPRGRVAT